MGRWTAGQPTAPWLSLKQALSKQNRPDQPTPMGGEAGLAMPGKHGVYLGLRCHQGDFPHGPAPDHRSGFANLEQERDLRIPTDAIRGTVPAAVRGTFLRIGPGRSQIGGQTFGHWFDGDGMVHALTFDDGGARYRNRFVRTPKYRAETAAGRIRKRGFGHNAPGGPWPTWAGRRPTPPTPASCASATACWRSGRRPPLGPGSGRSEHPGRSRLWRWAAAVRAVQCPWPPPSGKRLLLQSRRQPGSPRRPGEPVPHRHGRPHGGARPFPAAASDLPARLRPVAALLAVPGAAGGDHRHRPPAARPAHPERLPHP